MPRPRNALWIMCDQLRFDYLGCAGHPTLRTPAIDRLASRGVRFEHAYAQSPCCGPSRMSAYTGRYVRSHGATCNGFPLRVDERTVGDYLRPLGVRPLLIGKSHVAANEAALDWLGIERDSAAGERIVHGGFESLVRHDGEFMPDDSATDYHAYLKRCGFEGRNLWEEWAATAQGERGERLVGAFYENADKPARVPAGHSESAFITGRAEEFIESEGAGSSPWMMHLSYIKPHWPYLAPAPYHARYAAGDVVPANRVEGELEDPHPLVDAFMRQNYSRVLVPEAVRCHVIPAYMGLVAEVDDMIARVLACLRRTGLLDSTLIVLSADHGDYLGDHWLGEKYLFHDPSVRLPFIVVDPERGGGAHPWECFRVHGGAHRRGADAHRMVRRAGAGASRGGPFAAARASRSGSGRLAGIRRIRVRLLLRPRPPRPRQQRRHEPGDDGGRPPLQALAGRGGAAAALRPRRGSRRARRPRAEIRRGRRYVAN